jgi:hypothetical protein
MNIDSPAWKDMDELFKQPVFEVETQIIVTDGVKIGVGYVKGLNVDHTLDDDIKKWTHAPLHCPE